MSNVVSLFDAASKLVGELTEERDPHISGAAKCMACGHEWVAVVPVPMSTPDLACPKCDLSRGQLQYPVEPTDDANVWYCECGSTWFHLVRDRRDVIVRTLCAGCGNEQDF